MNATAPTPADILRAIERWREATKRGDLTVGDAVWIGSEHRKVSPAIALAWALLVETGAASVDVGRCPACGGRGIEERECKPVRGLERASLAVQGWWHDGGVFPTDEGEEASEIWRRRCPACTGTSRETIPAERLLLDAVSGDAAARDRLLVHADQLQADGDPLGALLAWALGPWSGEPTTPITRIATARLAAEAYELLPIDWAQKWESERDWTVAVCQTGPEEWTAAATFHRLGHPHTAEAVAWLDRLTAEREAAPRGEFAEIALTPAQRSTMLGLAGLAYHLQPAERRTRVGDAFASVAVGQMFGRLARDLMSADLLPGHANEDEQ